MNDAKDKKKRVDERRRVGEKKNRKEDAEVRANRHSRTSSICRRQRVYKYMRFKRHGGISRQKHLNEYALKKSMSKHRVS